jgi:hypothetical protein
MEHAVETQSDGKDVSESVQALKDDLSKFKTDMLELVKSLVHDGQARGTAFGRRLREAAAAKIDHARQAGECRIEHVEERIATHPIASVLAALGVGVLMGRFLRK